MTFQIAGETTHFIIQYDVALGAPALTVANALLGSCEPDLLSLTAYMPSHSGGGGDPFLHPKIMVQLLNSPATGAPGIGGADNNGQGPGKVSLIRINPLTAAGGPITADFAAFLFVAEMSEILMSFYNCDAITSQGEALSRVMAEELHPASSANFVNTWTSFPEPRPDWINKNEGLTPLARGDLDPIAFGCGIIFIYFLRYQLNISYDKICTNGGTTLADRYRTLTKAVDDPAARVAALLDKHFGAKPFRLVGNNPFPLFEGADRRVTLAFGRPTSVSHVLPFASGHAHVKPFFTCPTADYPFYEIGSAVTQTITATTVGIGAPTFRWSINGKPMFLAAQTGDTVVCPVDEPDPQNPDQPVHASQILTFDYKIDTTTTAAGTSSTLTLTSRSNAGDYQPLIRVDCDEQVAPTTPVSAQQTITISTRSVLYGGSYSDDQQRCERAFQHAVAGKVRVYEDALSRLKNLPDPPPGYLTTVIEAAEQIRQEIAQVAVEDRATAANLAHYAAKKLGVPEKVFLQPARGSGAA